MKKTISGITLIVLVLYTSLLTFNVQLATACKLMGDLNEDGIVNIDDLRIAADAFGSYPGHPRWNPQADLNGDKEVNMFDMCLIASYFGQTVPSIVAATVDIHPCALNLRCKGRWITAYIELPEGYNLSDIDVSTVRLNDTVSAELRPICIGDHDEDGLLDIMVKFDRQKVIELILSFCQPKEKFERVTLTISGELKNGIFQGSDEIKVIATKT